MLSLCRVSCSQINSISEINTFYSCKFSGFWSKTRTACWRICWKSLHHLNHYFTAIDFLRLLAFSDSLVESDVVNLAIHFLGLLSFLHLQRSFARLSNHLWKCKKCKIRKRICTLWKIIKNEKLTRALEYNQILRKIVKLYKENWQIAIVCASKNAIDIINIINSCLLLISWKLFCFHLFKNYQKSCAKPLWHTLKAKSHFHWYKTEQIGWNEHYLLFSYY